MDRELELIEAAEAIDCAFGDIDRYVYNALPDAIRDASICLVVQLAEEGVPRAALALSSLALASDEYADYVQLAGSLGSVQLDVLAGIHFLGGRLRDAFNARQVDTSAVPAKEAERPLLMTREELLEAGEKANLSFGAARLLGQVDLERGLSRLNRRMNPEREAVVLLQKAVLAAAVGADDHEVLATARALLGARGELMIRLARNASALVAERKRSADMDHWLDVLFEACALVPRLEVRDETAASSMNAELEEMLAPLAASRLGSEAPEGHVQMAKIQGYLATLSDSRTALVWLSHRIVTLPPTAGSWVCDLLASLVEKRPRKHQQLDANISAPGVVKFFRLAVDSMSAGTNTAEWAACSSLLGPALRIHLLANHRRQLSRMHHEKLFMTRVGALESENAACRVVYGLARHRSGNLTVLDPGNERGLQIRYANVSSCFHFFTLLQSILPPSWSAGRSQRAETQRAALGEESLTEDSVGDAAWFHYSQLTHTADIDKMVPGEATLDAIGQVFGQQVLTLSPLMGAELSWSAKFFGPQFNEAPPSIEVLSEVREADVQRLLKGHRS